MRVICDRNLLAPAFCSISRIAKNEIYPLYHAVLLIATSVQGQGTLTLVGMGMVGTVGLFTQLPATVQEEGSVLIPIEPLAEYIETLRSGSLTLSQVRTASSLVVEPIQGFSLATPKRVAPLLVESVYTSDAGALSTNTARLQAWSSAQYPLPPVQDWRRTPLFACTFQATLFKKALAACAPFAYEGAWSKESAAEMYGVLLRLDPHSVTLSATTGTMLISHRFLLEQPTTLSLAGLFEGKVLFWMKEALPKNGTIRFALTRDVQTQRLVLLLSTMNATWFCRSMDAPCPTHWEDILQQPHEAELLIRRGELKDPLKFLAKAAEGSEGVVFATEGTVLRMSTVASSDHTIHADQTLPLVRSSADFTVLVNPKQFSRLARLASGEMIQLEIGRVVRQEQQGKKEVGFLRASTERIQVMMSLSREEKRGAPEQLSHQ